MQVEVESRPFRPRLRVFARKDAKPRLHLALPEPWRVTRWLVLAVLLLLLASTACQVVRLRYGYTYFMGLIPLFFVDDEANVPTWYSSVTLLAAGGLLLLIGTALRARGDRSWRYWAALAAVFAALSIDEVAQIHELLIAPLRQALEATGYLFYPWVIPGTIFAAIVALAFTRFLFRLPRPTRAQFVVAGFLYIGGALGVETISARLDFEHGPADAGYVAVATVEEALEMFAIVLFLHALLGHLRKIAARSAELEA